MIKRSNLKRWVFGMALCLIFTLVFSLFAGGKQEPQPGTTTETKTEAKKVPELVWTHHFLGGRSPEADTAWTDALYKQTGIKVKIIKTSSTDYRTKLASMIAAGEQIDLAYLNWDQFDTLVKDNPNLFTPIEDRINKSSVFMNKKLFPDLKGFEAARKDDGHIYGVFYAGVGAPQAGTGPIIRWDWVKKLGLVDMVGDPPRADAKLTLDDWYKILRAFAYNDPDGNGKQDTYGITFGHTLYDATPWFGTLGLQRLYARDKDGKIYSPWTQDAAAPVFEWLARLYREKILEPNFVTNGSGAMRDLFMSNKVGVISYWRNWIHQMNDLVKKERPDSPFEARAFPLPKGLNGQAIDRSSPPAFDAIPSNSKYKDEAFKLLEFFQTEEGAVLGIYGAESFDWNMKEGKIILTEAGKLALGQHGILPLWDWQSGDWATKDNVYFADGTKVPNVRREETEATVLWAPYWKMEELLGRDEAQWEDEVPAADFGRIIRGEVNVLQGLADARKHMKELGLVDY
ncbi:MAG: extracellular solute-binding protein [Spirochaetota bacterium]